MESFRASKAPSTDILHIFPSLWKCELIGQNRLIGTSHEVILQPEEIWATESVKTTTIRDGFWLSQDVLLPSFGLHQLTSTADADYWTTVNPRVDPVHSLPIARGLRIHLNKSSPHHPRLKGTVGLRGEAGACNSQRKCSFFGPCSHNSWLWSADNPTAYPDGLKNAAGLGSCVYFRENSFVRPRSWTEFIPNVVRLHVGHPLEAFLRQGFVS
jgi:hypothetical protein